MMMKTIKNKMKILGLASLILFVASCSGQKELIAFKEEMIDSTQIVIDDIEAEKEQLEIMNEKLQADNMRLEREVKKMKYDRETNEELIDKRMLEVAAVENWMEEIEDITEMLKSYGVNTMFEEGKIRLNLDEGILFERGSVAISDRANDLLERFATAINKIEGVEFLVEGHTDNIPVGEPNSNWNLSVGRSLAVVESLIQDHNISPNKLMLAGKGMYDPIVANTSPQMRSVNRRVEFILIPNVDVLVEKLTQAQ